MIGPAFYEAYANVLVSQSLLIALYRDPDRIRTTYGLTADELELLRSASPGTIALSQGIIRAKRHGVLEQSLPQTMAVLREFDDYRLVGTYVDDALRRPDLDMLRPATHGTDFVADLTRQQARIPPRLLDLARFELAIADLRGDHAAASAARDKAVTADAGGADLGGQARPWMTADVRVVAASIDVLALPAETTLAALAAAPSRPGGVLLRKVWDQPRPLFHRIGVATVELLLRCDGRHTVDQLLDQVAGDDAGHREGALATLRGLAGLTVLSVTRE